MNPGRFSFHSAKGPDRYRALQQAARPGRAQRPSESPIPVGLHQPVYRRCAHRTQLLGHLRCHLQLLPCLQPAHQLSHEWRKALAADPSRNRPHLMERRDHPVVVAPRAADLTLGALGATRTSQQPDRRLPVVSGHLRELVQQPALLAPSRSCVTHPHRFRILFHAASLHASPGNMTFEATIPPSVTFIMRQLGHLTPVCSSHNIHFVKSITNAVICMCRCMCSWGAGLHPALPARGGVQV